MSTIYASYIHEDFENTSNYLDSVAPADGDDLIVRGISVDVTVNYDQSDIELNSLRFTRELGVGLTAIKSFGSAAHPITFGDITESILVDVPSAMVQLHLALSEESTAGGGVPILSIHELGMRSGGFVFHGGYVGTFQVQRCAGVSIQGGEIDELLIQYLSSKKTDAMVAVASGVSLAELRQSGGIAELACSVDTKLICNGGIAKLTGSSKTFPLVEVSNGGRIEDWANGGTRTKIIVGSDGDYDGEVVPYTKTITNADLMRGAIFRSNNGAIIHTNRVRDFGAAYLSVPTDKLSPIGKIPAPPR